MPEPYQGQGLYQHPDVEDCLVRVTDGYGAYIDEATIVETPEHRDRRAFGVINGEIVINAFTFIDDIMANFFFDHGMPRLGGASTGRGWTSFSIFQKCPYLWKHRYRGGVGEVETIHIEPMARSVGTLLHSFLALHYAAKIEGHPVAELGLTPDMLKTYAIAKGGNPAFILEAWRVWVGYRLYYKFEDGQPLAVEQDLVDPRTGESTRFDTIMFYENDAPNRLAGTWIVEHKSASRFDQPTLYGWANDGEVIGQVALWKRLGLDRRYGPLQGVIVNILGKQPKEPKFHRTHVRPFDWQIEQHLRDLAIWEGKIQLAISSNSFPRARQSCIGRYGLCDLFEHCAGGGPDEGEWEIGEPL